MAEAAWDVYIGASTIQNVRSASYTDGAQIIADRASGSAAPSAQYLGDADPTMTIQTSDIGNVVSLNTGLFASEGVCITPGTTILPIARRADCGFIQSGAVHSSVSSTNTLLYPTSFEARQGTEPASATIEAKFHSSNGLTSALTINTAYTLTATTYGACFGLGKVLINSVAVPLLQSVMVSPQLNFSPQRSSGGIYTTTHYLLTSEPTIEITTEDVQWALGLVPTAGATVPVEAYFRRRQDGGVFVADASLVHVRFAFAGSLAKTEGFEVNQNSNGTATVKIYGRTLVTAAGVAIP